MKNSDKYFYFTFNGILEKRLLLCEFFFSFSKRVKNEAGENKGFRNYNGVGIYASYKFQ